MVVLLEESQEEGESQHKAIVAKEGLGRNAFVDLLLPQERAVDVVDRQGWDYQVEELQVLVLLLGYLSETLHQDTQIICTVGEGILQGFEDVVKIITGLHSGL